MLVGFGASHHSERGPLILQAHRQDFFRFRLEQDRNVSRADAANLKLL
jgi:hypothetical protein